MIAIAPPSAGSTRTTPTARPQPLAMGVRERDAGRRQPALRPRRAGPARRGRPARARRRCSADDAADDRVAASGRLRAGRLDRVAGQPADRPRDGQPRLAAPVRPRPGADAGQLRRRRRSRRATRSCSTTWPCTFMDDGWSVKKLIRRIVLSRAYQLGVRRTTRRNFEADPDNALVWRMSQAAARRRGASATPCSPSAASSTLDAAGRLAGGRRSATGRRDPCRGSAGRLDAADRRTASVYLPVVRDQLPEALALFDFADPSLVVGERATTTVPAQALYLMNSPFVHAGRPRPLAERLLRRAATTTRPDRRGLPARSRPRRRRPRSEAAPSVPRATTRRLAGDGGRRRPARGAGRRSARRCSPPPSSGTSIEPEPIAMAHDDRSDDPPSLSRRDLL